MCSEQTKLRQCLLGPLRLSIGPFDRSLPKCNDTLALLGLEFLVAHCPEHPSQGLDIFWRSVLENVFEARPIERFYTPKVPAGNASKDLLTCISPLKRKAESTINDTVFGEDLIQWSSK